MCRKCGISGRYAPLEIDHIIPIAKGGKSTYNNLQTLCHKWNAKKGDTLEYWQKDNAAAKGAFGGIDIGGGGESLTASLTFIDSGVSYNPLEKEDPDTTLSAEDRKIGGLGIFLVKKSMDDMRYEFKDGKNILTLVKKLAWSSAASSAPKDLSSVRDLFVWPSLRKSMVAALRLDSHIRHIYSAPHMVCDNERYTP